jgi:hypothetical protein
MREQTKIKLSCSPMHFSARVGLCGGTERFRRGSLFDETIESALNSARCVVVLWSKHSVSSRWVKTEAAEGAERGILVPAMIDNAPIPLEFKRIEAADLSDWEGEASHREFDQLLKSVAAYD